MAVVNVVEKTTRTRNKPTVDIIRQAFESEGWKLLSDEYVSAKSKLDFRCNKGHRHQISWDMFRMGYRCAHCSGNAKKTISGVRRSFASRGWKLLSTEYKGSHQKLDFQCDKGHKHEITWNDFQSGKGCVYCSGLVKPLIDTIRQAFDSRGWKLLSTEYINTKSKLDFQCDKGHRHQINWNNFQLGRGCGICQPFGVDPVKPAMFYYVRIEHDGKILYKMGVTAKGIKERFRKDKLVVVLLHSVQFQTGADACKYEHDLLNKYSRYRMTKRESRHILMAGGTELFYFDVMGVDSMPTTKSKDIEKLNLYPMGSIFKNSSFYSDLEELLFHTPIGQLHHG